VDIQVEFLLAAYCLLIVLASLAGGWLPSLIQLTHTRMQVIVSLVGGLMLGVGLFHMLPHAYSEIGSLDTAVWWLMMGLLAMFFLVRTLHFHQHEPPQLSPAAEAHHRADHHDHHHDHDRDVHTHRAAQPSTHRISWIGVACGLALHTLIDGIALAASVEAESGHDVWLLGLGTFLAILLHKPLDAVSITSLMAAGGWSSTARNLVNAGFALMCPLGAACFVLGVGRFVESQHLIVGCALAFSAGVFVCISLGDLLPEVEFHSHDRIKLSAALLLGVALAYGNGLLESDHMHSHSHAGAGQSGDASPDPAHTHVQSQ
jgi:zinc and cadmium transporter